MWSEIILPDTSVLETVVRSALVFVAVMLLIRLGGKRGLAEMSAFDVVVVLLLAEVIGSAAVGPDNSVTAGVVAAVMIVLVNRGFVRLVHRSAAASRVLQGRATTVIKDGEVDEKALRRMEITRKELDHTVRAQNGDDISEVASGELTPSGKMVVTLKFEEQSSTKADVAELKEELRELRALLTRRS